MITKKLKKLRKYTYFINYELFKHEVMKVFPVTRLRTETVFFLYDVVVVYHVIIVEMDMGC